MLAAPAHMVACSKHRRTDSALL